MAADGSGASLQRVNPAAYGDDPANWQAAVPTPGTAFMPGEPPLILTQPQSRVIQMGESVGFAVTALLLIKVVPQFESLFHGFGAELPAMTRMTIAMSEFAQQYWWWGLLGVVGVVFFIRAGMKRSEAFAYRMHALSLKIPVIGDILDKSCVARYSRTLATTFGAGVPLVEALITAAGAAGNKVYERAIEQIREDVATGQQLHFAMRLTERFPPLAVQMVGIGEEAGALDAMLNRVADYYEEEVDNKVDTLTSLLEPLIIVVLGVLVGGLVISMYLPIFELGSVI